MAAVAHTYGPTCLLHPELNAFTRRATDASPGPPAIKPQFFFSSALPIDDPLSPVPPPPSGSISKSAKLPPQPFSIYDNAALEEAWLRLQQEEQERAISRLRDQYEKGSSSAEGPEGHSDNHFKVTGDTTDSGSLRNPKQTPSNAPSTRGAEESQPSALKSAVVRKAEYQKRVSIPQPDLTLSDDPRHVPFDETLPIEANEIVQDALDSGLLKKKRSRSPFRRKGRTDNEQDGDQKSSHSRLSQSLQKAQDNFLGSSPGERDTSGTPFLRIRSRLRHKRSHSRSRSQSPNYPADIPQADGEMYERPSSSHFARPSFQRFGSDRSESSSIDRPRGRRQPSLDSTVNDKAQNVHIAVGVSRLHVVEMPSFKMGPIYWDPVHDISSVVRATWFYKETMWPVESDLANQIEEGYHYIQPWTQTYVDEMNICQEIGPEAEIKLVHRIWPPEEPLPDGSRPGTSKSKTAPQEMTNERKTQSIGTDPKIAFGDRATGLLDGFDDQDRLYPTCSVIYANARDAQILRPNQLPSFARGRRPLANIRKGRPVGIPVVRGFDQRSWEKLHPPPRKMLITAKTSSPASTRASTTQSQKLPPCEACLTPEERPKPSDLILVIHGIGQKLSERVESFHFTHAINSFRRLLNVELEVDTVKPWLRPGLGTIMILPINWRSKINLDDGESELETYKEGSKAVENQYTLKDITAESIPAVRNLMSDVLLDIPLYLSHHKPKLIEAVLKEANRVYRLWCNNNPGFHENGRVHLIAHSLGSVMTMDILSKQPTKLPPQLDFKDSSVRKDMFEFDTKSLFFLGSPAGLFLFLNQVPLIPRKGREKPGANGEDLGSRVAGEAGTYGCLAVDNLYNVMHHIDPVAYQLNACVDVNYAASLRKAFVPSTALTWAQYFGLTKPKGLPPHKALTGLDNFASRPGMQSMPSTVEMETHDFTREELAERRMYLLNDNGQIDFTLQAEGGPLQIQYLNMLSAHSSYWTMQDFVRFLVVEVGRMPGKGQTIASIEATKKGRGKK